MSKCILIVIDSLGVGEAPDAENYGDIGANTFGNVAKANGQLNLCLLYTSDAADE